MLRPRLTRATSGPDRSPTASSSSSASSCSPWSEASLLVRSASACFSSRSVASRPAASAQLVIEQRLDLCYVEEISACSLPTSASPSSSRRSSFALIAPRPQSIAESSCSILLSVDGDRSASPAPSFMSALSAGEYNWNREQRSRPHHAGSDSPGPLFEHSQQQRRSMSPDLSSPTFSGPAHRVSHWRSRTFSPPPPLTGPPPTRPLPPTPPAEPIALPSPTTSPRSHRRRSDTALRWRAEARADLEGHPFFASLCFSQA